MFDHSHALFREADSLDIHEGRLGITKDRPHYNRHCLLDHIATDVHFSKWVNRIRSVADEVMEEIFREAGELGLPLILSQRGLEFLKNRRDTLARLITTHQHEFRGIAQWSLQWSA